MDDPPVDLGALRAGPADADRVVNAAMRRIRSKPRRERSWRVIAETGAGWARPVMAAAAVLSLAAMLVLAIAGPHRDVPTTADLFSERYASGDR